jgi:hypothetical protein
MFPSLCLRPIRRSNGSGLVRASAGEAGGRAGPLITRTVPRRGPATVALAVVALVTGTALAHAQAPVSVSGLPQQVIATFPEIGAPTFTTSPGTPSAGDTGGQGTGDAGESSTDGSGGSSDALNTMLGQPWGSTAVNNAEALGVNPSALAATCVIESGCQNVAGSGTVAGAFQMTASTFNSSLNAALQQDPSLAANVVQGTAGQMDPATESIAASEYLYQGAHTLQNGGVTNPTVLDVRGFYNFGPQNGVALATAPADQPMSATLAGISSATLAANGITPGETVGQWRTAVSAKIGNTAGQPVLN